jgi:(p)ppGpp synthase/HD superfamily hydrolase
MIVQATSAMVGGRAVIADPRPGSLPHMGAGRATTLVPRSAPPDADRAFPSFVDELPVTRRALAFAARRHRGQRRDADHAPFILHPLEVAQLLRGRGYPDEVVAAGVLHDVIEDGHAEHAELLAEFGEPVARVVLSVSEPPVAGTWTERKARLRAAVAEAEPDAVAVYAADKVAKVRELRLTLVRCEGRSAMHDDKLEHYWASLELLERRLGGHPLVNQLRFELEALALLPPE